MATLSTAKLHGRTRARYRFGSGDLLHANAEACCCHEDLAEKHEQAQEEGHHRSDEKEGYDRGCRVRIDLKERSQEKDSDHRANEQCRDGTEGDRTADNLARRSRACSSSEIRLLASVPL